MMVAAAPEAWAIDAVSVRSDAPAIDLTAVRNHQRSDTDRIQVSTAPGTDGIVRRIEVRAREGGQHWVVFALANNTDDQLDRLIVAPHYRIVSSGLLWPDLGLSRIATITPSTGDRPERQESATADIFRITLDPGAVITFVAELRTDKLPQLYLWEPDAYKDKVNSFTLYQGIVIGISGLLALVLTILFVVKGSIMFPAAAALAWAVLVYIGVDFGFWGKVLDMSNNAERVWRAAGEAILAATPLVFLFAYLNLSRWHVRHSHITVGWPGFLGWLGALPLFGPRACSGTPAVRALEGPAAKWLEVLHPLDQDRFRAALDSVLDQRRGRLVQDFRLRTPDGHFMWFALKARPVVGSDGEVSRVVGTLTDVTEMKNAEERLLHDSVHDNLTGLPNRKLFIDRLCAVANFSKTMPTLRPTLMVIDLDRFKQVNDSVGIAVGDSILLTLSRRLTRILKPQDTLARLSGDQFGLILMSEQDPARITAFAETIRKTISAPIAFNDREILLTASIGLALSDPQTQLSDEIIKDAELAMYHSKRIGGDRIDVYKPAMRARKTDRLTLESELRRAIEREEITILYQPIVGLEDRSIAGFGALARRFRHRPFVLGLSAALPVRHHQDRPVIRAHHQPRHPAGDPEVDHCAGPRPRHGCGGGRRGNRFRRGRALPVGMRIRSRI